MTKTPNLVRDLMSVDVVTLGRNDTLVAAEDLMRLGRIRHLPVLADDGGVVGMISIGDLNAYQVDHQERTIHQLKEYIHGTW